MIRARHNRAEASLLGVHPGYLEFLRDEPREPRRAVAFSHSGPLAAGLREKPPGLARPAVNKVLSTLVTCTIGILIFSAGRLSRQEPALAEASTAPTTATIFTPNIQRFALRDRHKWHNINKILAYLIERSNDHSRALTVVRDSSARRDTGAELPASREEILLEVTAAKANLRIAPSEQASAIMAVSRGTQLLSFAGEVGWFQVFAPTGESLWISDQVVQIKKSARH